MVYENRLTVNYAFGSLSNAAAVSDTTLVSAEFATALPSALSATTYVPISLQDPNTRVCEVVWATGHTAASTSATVVRGREGLAARAWPSGTLWGITPTVRDGILQVANRAALPTDPHTGMRCWITDENLMIERSPVCWGWPMAHLRQSVAQPIPSGVPTTLQFGAEDFDNAGGHDNTTNNSRYTCKMAGWYQVAGGAGFTSGGGGYRIATLYRNGAPLLGSVGWAVSASPGGIYTATPIRTTHVLLAVGDYVELFAYQDSGTTLSTIVSSHYESTLSVRHLGGL